MTRAGEPGYRPTEAKYKGGAHESYVTYELEQRTRGGGRAAYPKVKRVYIAGDIRDWRAGTHEKRTGRKVHGVCIDYEQSRRGYRRRPYAAQRGATGYEVGGAAVGPAVQHFAQVVEVPERARDVHFYRTASELPPRYRQALQRIR